MLVFGQARDEISLRRRTVVLSMLGLTALVSLLLAIIDLLRMPPAVVDVGDGARFFPDIDYALFASRFRIAIALLVASGPLISRRVLGVVISLVGLFWVVAEYYLWWSRSVRFGGVFASNTPGDIQYLFFLRNARIWDIMVIVIAVSMLTLELIMILRILKSRHTAGG